MPEATEQRHGTKAYAGLDFIRAAFCPLEFNVSVRRIQVADGGRGRWVGGQVRSARVGERPVALSAGRATALSRSRRGRRVTASAGFRRLITGRERCLDGMRAGCIEVDGAASMAARGTCL